MTEKERLNIEFVKTWMEAVRGSHGTAWIADKLHLERRYVVNKVETLRKRGVKLPPMPGGHIPYSPNHIQDLRDILENEGTRDHPDLTTGSN